LVHDFLFYSLREASSQPTGSVEIDADAGHSALSYASGEKLSGFNNPADSYHRDRSGFVSESANVHSSSYYQNTENSGALIKPLGLAIAKIQNDYLLAQNQAGLLLVTIVRARSVVLQ